MARCKESAGVLYPHPCTREGTVTCGRCNKSICQLHSREAGGGAIMCITCYRSFTPVTQDTDDAFLLSAAIFSDYDTSTVVRSRLNQAMLSADDNNQPDFETEFDGT